MSTAENLLATSSADVVLNALPHPVIVVAADGKVTDGNAAAEAFFEVSVSHLRRHLLRDLVPFGSPLLTLIEQVRARGAAVNEYKVDLGTPRNPGDRLVDLYVAPLPEQPNSVVVMLQERTIADKMDRQLTHRSAARSVIALAAMLAHEIKNPLSGIRGAAQLLEQSVDDDDRTLTQLICDEADRIVKLVDRMEVFADERPIERAPRHASRCRWNSASRTTAPACPTNYCRICSTRSSPPSRPDRGWAWRWSPRSSATTAASSNASRSRAEPSFACLCRFTQVRAPRWTPPCHHEGIIDARGKYFGRRRRRGDPDRSQSGAVARRLRGALDRQCRHAVALGQPGRRRSGHYRRAVARRKRLRPVAAHQESAAGFAGRGHERAKHLHDRDPRLRARRLRISAKTVRPEGADFHRRPRLVRAEGKSAAAGQGRGFRIHSAGRPLAGDAGNLPRAGTADAD